MEVYFMTKKTIDIIKKILICTLKLLYFPYYLTLTQFNCDYDEYWDDDKKKENGSLYRL